LNSQIIIGDCREVLKTISSNIIHCCVTSPPYFGLRDYGTATWNGGDASCDHVADPTKTKKFGNPAFNENRPSREMTKVDGYYFKDVCGKCGAICKDEQIGQESTIEDYVDQMVEVFREVRRILRDDGTLWLNLGDSYAAQRLGSSAFRLKHKDLIGIPWRVAFALQADGWYLRQDIIWHKPNPMPESVTDRCTKAHEYIFLLAKSERYYFDAKAIAEKALTAGTVVKASNPQTAKNASKGKFGATSEGFTKHDTVVGETRNRRTVWTVNTKPFRGAHFATFPTDLVMPCILAGAPVDGTVLDPFNGAGTTGLVALQNARRYVGIELNPEYANITCDRLGLLAPPCTVYNSTPCEVGA
jgi:DNA modification methylase